MPVQASFVFASSFLTWFAVQETVDLVEEIAMQYITDTVHTAMRAAATRTAAGARCVCVSQLCESRLPPFQ